MVYRILRVCARSVRSLVQSERSRSVEGFVLAGDSGPDVSAPGNFEHILAD